MNYVSAVRSLEIADYPLGGDFRGICRYIIEQSKNKGKRIVRETQKKNSAFFNAPKKLTYATDCAILTGEDGKTYPANLHADYRMISVFQSNMQYQHETIHKDSDPTRYYEVVNLISNAK